MRGLSRSESVEVLTLELPRGRRLETDEGGVRQQSPQNYGIHRIAPESISLSDTFVEGRTLALTGQNLCPTLQRWSRPELSG